MITNTQVMWTCVANGIVTNGGAPASPLTLKLSLVVTPKINATGTGDTIAGTVFENWPAYVRAITKAGDWLIAFAREREASLLWLRSLGNVDWKIAYIHPKVGPVTAGELLVSWAAHDALHVRQIAKRMFELAARDGEPEGFSTRYAGEWSA